MKKFLFAFLLLPLLSAGQQIVFRDAGGYLQYRMGANGTFQFVEKFRSFGAGFTLNNGVLNYTLPQIAYGTLSGLPTLGTAAAFNVATSGAAASNQIVLGNDPRLFDPRTPLAHTHSAGQITSGVFPTTRIGTGTPGAGMYVDGLTGEWTLLPTTGGVSSFTLLTDRPILGTAAALNVPVSGAAAAGEVVRGNDPRLTDFRQPLSHVHTASDLTSGVLSVSRLGGGSPVAGSYVDGGTGLWTPLPTGGPSSYTALSDRPTFGTAAFLNAPLSGDAVLAELVRGSDTRLTNARTPLSHVHAAGEITSGVFPTSRIGSGTPLAGRYVDGATGAWTQLPQAGDMFRATYDPDQDGIVNNAATATNATNLNNQPASFYTTYSNQTGRPTLLSQFTNDANFQSAIQVGQLITNALTNYVTTNTYANNRSTDQAAAANASNLTTGTVALARLDGTVTTASNPQVLTNKTVPQLPTSDTGDGIVSMKTMRQFLADSLAKYINFKAGQFVVKPNGMIELDSTNFLSKLVYTSPAASTTAASGSTADPATAFTSINNNANEQLVYVDSTSAYFKPASSLTDWGSGGNTGRLPRQLPAATKGFVEFQYLGAISNMSIVGFQTTNTNDYSTNLNNKAAAFVGDNGFLHWGDGGNFANDGFSPTVGMWIRITHNADGTFLLSTSMDRAAQYDPRHVYTYTSNVVQYVGAVIHFQHRIYKLQSSTNFVTN